MQLLGMTPEPKQWTAVAAIGEGEQRADGVGGIPQGRQAGPVRRPALHVLVMGAAQELDAAECALLL